MALELSASPRGACGLEPAASVSAMSPSGPTRVEDLGRPRLQL